MQILGTVSNKIWNAIVNHAMNCVIDDNRLFVFQRHNLDVGVVFNAIHKVVGAFFNGQYLPLDALSPSQKVQFKVSLHRVLVLMFTVPSFLCCLWPWTCIYGLETDHFPFFRQQILVENLKQQAYRNVNELVPVDGLAIAGPSRTLPEPSNDSTIDFQHDFSVAQHGRYS